MKPLHSLRKNRFWLLVGVLPLLGIGLAATLADSKEQSKTTEKVADSPSKTQANSLSEAFRSAAQKVQPAVVMIQNISTATPVSGDSSPRSGIPREFRDMPELRRFFDQAPHQRRGPSRGGIGSGVIIDSSGIILTNNHVIDGGGQITVRLSDGREFKATTVKADPKTDLAILRIEGAKDLVAARLGNSDHMNIGDWVLALGQPFGLEGTVTAGIISAKERGIGITDRENFLQTDAAINPGNSGGPLVNLDGEVIGINTAISSSSGGNQGIGFAVPINLAKWVSGQLISGGEVKRAFLGVGIQPVTHALARQFGLERNKGVVVSEVRPDTPAALAGLQVGDVLLKFAGEEISGPRELQVVVEKSVLEHKQPIEIIRDGEKQTLFATLRVRHTEDQANAASSHRYSKYGVEVSDLTQEVAKSLKLSGQKGVVITYVDANGAAAKAGLKTGMVIVEVNRKAISSPAEFAEAVKKTPEGKGLLMLVRTAEGTRFVVLSAGN